jgi:hypothetical protein
MYFVRWADRGRAGQRQMALLSRPSRLPEKLFYREATDK